MNSTLIINKSESETIAAPTPTLLCVIMPITYYILRF